VTKTVQQQKIDELKEFNSIFKKSAQKNNDLVETIHLANLRPVEEQMTPAEKEQYVKDRSATSYAVIGYWRKEGPPNE